MPWNEARDRFTYTVGKLRRTAESYADLKKLAYSGSRGWAHIIDGLADFDTAVDACGLRDKFGSYLRGTNRWGLSRADYEEMCTFLNGGER